MFRPLTAAAALAALALLPPVARARAAQDASDPPPPQAAPQGPGRGDAVAPEGAAGAADAAAPESEAAAIQEEVESLKEQLTELADRVRAFLKLQLSGYVQGRYQWNEAADPGPGVGAELPANEGFSVRRGRLDARYDTTWTRLRLQLDAVPSGVSLRDAEVHLKLPRELGSLAVGQMKWPFGYESQQSSAERELPERSRVVQAFLPGERDRGVRLTVKRGLLDLSGGVFDGNGTEHRLQSPEGFDDGAALPARAADRDNDRSKDLIGRVGADLGWIAGGVSGWWGETFRPGSTGGAAGPLGGGFYRRSRLGADVQLLLDLVFVGRTALKGEWIAGKTPFSGVAEQFAGVDRERVAHGWYALVVQSVGISNAVAFRFDRFDPRSGVRNAGTAGGVAPREPPPGNAIHTYGVAAIHHFDPALKLTVAYELPVTETRGDDRDPDDDLFTVQLQAQF